MSAGTRTGGVAAEPAITDSLELIGAYVTKARWSGAAGRRVESVQIVDWLRLGEDEPALYFTVTRVRFDGGFERDYALPLGLRRVGDVLAERAPDFMIGMVQRENDDRFLYDALGDPEYVCRLWRAFHEQATLTTAAATLEFTATDVGALDPDLEPPLRVLGAEQSNTSLILGDDTFVKHLRRVEPGPSQELEMLGALGSAGFTHLAPLLGAALYTREPDAPTPVILVQPFLHNGTEGWSLALTSLRDLYADAEDALNAGVTDRLVTVDEHGGAFTAEAARLGTVTAEMHLSLTQPGLGAEIEPRPLTRADLEGWADQMTRELDALLGDPDSLLDPLRARRDAVAARFEELRDIEPGGLRTRVHGDLHLGQTLRVDSGWIILDFEGEPDRTPRQRRELSSPLRDVAGMLRSFDYAAVAALSDRLLPDSPDWEGMLEFGETWARVNRDAFWAAYLETANGRGLLPAAGPALALRRAFEVQKAVYEVRYELGHRPTWTMIPLRFLLRGTGDGTGMPE